MKNKNALAALRDVEDLIEKVVADRSVSRSELHDFLEEIVSKCEGIVEGLNADERSGR